MTASICCMKDARLHGIYGLHKCPTSSSCVVQLCVPSEQWRIQGLGPIFQIYDKSP
jgi:hypothetical protein